MRVNELLFLAIDKFAWILYILVFVRCIVSWLPINHSSRLIQLLYALTEPILAPIRSIIEKSPLGGRGMIIDFSPIIALFFVEIVKNILQTLVYYIPF